MLFFYVGGVNVDLQRVGRVDKQDLTGLFVGTESDSIVRYTFWFGPANVAVDNCPDNCIFQTIVDNCIFQSSTCFMINCPVIIYYLMTMAGARKRGSGEKEEI